MLFGTNGVLLREYIIIGVVIMYYKITKKSQQELIDILRNANAPQDAYATAKQIIICFLKQHESSEEPAVVAHQEHY